LFFVYGTLLLVKIKLLLVGQPITVEVTIMILEKTFGMIIELA